MMRTKKSYERAVAQLSQPHRVGAIVSAFVILDFAWKHFGRYIREAGGQNDRSPRSLPQRHRERLEWIEALTVAPLFEVRKTRGDR
jgi:hypothetical protein